MRNCNGNLWWRDIIHNINISGELVTCWMALWHLDACHEGCEGHGTANGLPQPRIKLAEISHEQTVGDIRSLDITLLKYYLLSV